MLSDTSSELFNPMALTRNKRDEFLIEIRKKKNRNFIQEKRLKLSKDTYEEAMPGMQEEESSPTQYFEAPPEQQESNQMGSEVESKLKEAHDQFYAVIQAQAWEEVTPVVKFLRESIGAQKDAIPGKYIIETGIIPPLLNLLSEEFRPYQNLQVEIVWLLANIASDTSDDTKYLVEQNVIPILSTCLKEESLEKLHENIMWTFANICGDTNLSFRDAVLQAGVMDQIVRELCTRPKPLSYYKIAAWLISNLVRGKPYPPFQKVARSLPALSHLMKEDSEGIKQNTLLSLIYLSEDSKEENLKGIADNNLLSKIIGCIDSKNTVISRYAVRIIGNVASGTKDLMSNLNEKILQIVPSALENPERNIRKEACSTLAAVFTNNFEDHDYVLDYDIIPILVKLANEDEDEIKSLATLAIFRYIADSSVEDARVVLENQMMEVIFKNLASSQVKLVDHSLLTLYKILEHGETLKHGREFNGKNPYLMEIIESNVVYIIENLLNFPDDDIHAKVTVLLGKFFPSDPTWSEGI